jgi:hypothetical protein
VLNLELATQNHSLKQASSVVTNKDFAELLLSKMIQCKIPAIRDFLYETYNQFKSTTTGVRV